MTVTKMRPIGSHRCHAIGCETRVPPRLLMCAPHWRMVPRELQRQVWATYRDGLEIDKAPSPKYLDAQQAAIAAVRELEIGQRPPWAQDMREMAPGLNADGEEHHIDASAFLAHHGFPPTETNVDTLIRSVRLTEIPVSVVEPSADG